MITDVVLRSLKSRSQLIPVDKLLNDCAASRMPEVIAQALTEPIATRIADVCPTGAITTESRVGEAMTLRLDYGKCIGCGRCMDAGDGAVRLAGSFSRCGVSRKELIRTWKINSEAEESNAAFPAVAREAIYGLIGRALNIRQLDPGSCNGCEAEITALTNPYYDLERWGIHFVASPKHADMLLVTGPITSNMAAAARKTYEAVPWPKLVVAVGACGCSAGIFDPCNRASRPTETATIPRNEVIIGPVDSVLPVDGYIPGCPPTPPMLISGILAVLRRRTLER
ncbi:MAG TPA: hydrogenase [Candidatus Angelobacter sp.]|nr:hydrogenase [Candidatus Angelobacter sp.]